MRPRRNFRAALRVTPSQKETQSRSARSLETQKNQTANKLFFERPLRWSRPRPQTQVVFLPPDPVWASRALIPTRSGPPCVVSDSLVDDRGCLTHGPEQQAFPCDVNLQCRRPLNSTLDHRLLTRVLYLLLTRPPNRPPPLTPTPPRS